MFRGPDRQRPTALITGLVLVPLVGACGENATGPGARVETPPTEIPFAAPTVPSAGIRVINVDPAEVGNGCWRYTVTLSADTVAASDPAAEMEIFVKLLEDTCHTNNTPLDNVFIGLTHLFSSDPIGIPLVSQMPPSQVFSFQVNPNPSPGFNAWALNAITDAAGEVRIPYQTAGAAGNDSLRLFPFIVDFADGPLLQFDVVTVEPAELEVSCTPNPITRGEEVTCTASGPPGASVEVQEWKFVGDGHEVVEALTETTWSGIMVIGGTVTVRAEVDGTADTASTELALTPRDWPDDMPTLIGIEFIGCPFLTVDCPLFYPPFLNEHMGATTEVPQATVPDELADFVSDGPNSGWSYIASDGSPIRTDKWQIQLNQVLQDPSDPFWDTRTDCVVADVENNVRTHELAHFSRAEAIIGGQVIGVNRNLEAAVEFSNILDFLDGRLRRERQNVFRRIELAADRQHFFVPLGDPGCDLRLQSFGAP